MKWQVGKVAVLGSGVMGSAIAAHFANAGIPSLVLDIVPADLDGGSGDRRARDRIAREAVAALRKQRPSPLFVPERIDLIEVGNLSDDLPRLAEADWVIEVVREDPEIKDRLFRSIAPHLGANAVLSSNTSGLSLAAMSASLPETLRSRFLGTHFFNPPRYMRLLELIPTRDTAPDVLDRVEAVAAERLGKGVVRAKDTVNFIANRIGVHALMATLQVMQERELTIEEVDALTGPVLGRPGTATFKLADLVGLDTLQLVAANVYRNAESDESREVFRPPAFLAGMVQAGLLGRKSGGGFYRRERDGTIRTLDLERMEYRDRKPGRFPELAALARIDDPAQRLATLVGLEGRGAEAARNILDATLSYAAMRVGEIVDDAATLDRAMELGFNWKLGPFASWDAAGFRETSERIRAAGRPLPDWIEALESDGAVSIFRDVDGQRSGPASHASGVVPVPADPRAMSFEALRRRGGTVRSNESASLLDLGQGVLGLEFHSKMNAIDAGTMQMMADAAEEAEANWQALVVANDGDNFCAGANLKLLASAIDGNDWDGIRNLVRSFQHAVNRLEFCGVPVVVAPHALALGGGCEVVLGADLIRAASETYMGLVEVGAGLIPAGGGCMRLYRRNLQRVGKDDLPAALVATFQSIGMAKVSGSAEDAQALGFLRDRDGWTMNRDHLVVDARRAAISMAGGGYAPRIPDPSIPVLGRGGIAVVEAMLFNMQEGRFISEHDRKIGGELAAILSGGDLHGPTTVSEQRILELEEEAFLRLCGESKTRDRILALLETGKPLRN